MQLTNIPDASFLMPSQPILACFCLYCWKSGAVPCQHTSAKCVSQHSTAWHNTCLHWQNKWYRAGSLFASVNAVHVFAKVFFLTTLEKTLNGLSNFLEWTTARSECCSSNKCIGAQILVNSVGSKYIEVVPCSLPLHIGSMEDHWRVLSREDAVWFTGWFVVFCSLEGSNFF